MTSTPDSLTCAVFIVTAFVASGIAHVLWLRSPASRRFSFPLDGGLSLGDKRIFGSHKMFRGFVVMVPAAGAAFGLLFTVARIAAPASAAQLWPLTSWQYALIGFWAGFGFMAGELPNSFVKRRLAIPPGDAPANPAVRMIFFAVDHLDSIIGMLLALSLVVTIPLWTWVYVAGIGLGIHWAFSALLFVAGVKERPA